MKDIFLPNGFSGCIPCRFVAAVFTTVTFLFAETGLAGDLPISRLESSQSIQIDGRLTESVWQQLPAITDWYRLTPDEGAPPSQKTEMWFTYDEEAIYLAARLHDTQPELARSRSLERDSFSPEQDGICLLLDTYNDNRTGFGFIVTPDGVRTDIAVFNDAEARFDAWYPNWNTFWDAATSRDEQGWCAEIRIPFTSLRFQADDETITMGVILWRYLARNGEYDIFPKIPNRWRYSAFKPSQALDINLHGVRPGNPVYIKPYVLGGLARSPQINETGNAYTYLQDWQKDVGLDVKYNLSSSTILDVTFNTDFAQVEADDQQINTTRFSLFFPEKRDFFQERADLFYFRFPGGRDRLFQSRRIGIIDGQHIPILGGLRLTGHTDRHEFGLIEMQTRSHELNDGRQVNSENFTVARYRHTVFEKGSYVGAMVTSRQDFRGAYNTAVAADGDIRVFGNHYFQFQVVQGFAPGLNVSQNRYASLKLQRRMLQGISFGLSAAYYGPQFTPGMGFLTRNGIYRMGNRTQYTTFPGQTSPLQRQTLTNHVGIIWQTAGRHSIESIDNRLYWDGLFKSSATLHLEWHYQFDRVPETFSVGAITFAPGRYTFHRGVVEYKSPAGDRFRYDAKITAGGFYGGRQVQITLSPWLTLSRHLNLALDYEYDAITTPAEQFRAHLARWRTRISFSRTTTLNAFIQLNTEIHELAANLRFRYNPVEGSDFYLVYNENINTTLTPEATGEPLLPRNKNRTVLVKYTYTFIR